MLLTLVQFNSIRPLEFLIDSQDIHSVPQLRLGQVQPRGNSPLYDAVARVIGHAERVERGGRGEVVVVVFSDGMENASKDYSQQQVFRLVEAKRREGWSFVLLGANQDAHASGSALAFSKGSVSNFKADERGVRAVLGDLSQGTTRLRRAARKAKLSPSAASALPEMRQNFLRGYRSAERDIRQRG